MHCEWRSESLKVTFSLQVRPDMLVGRLFPRIIFANCQTYYPEMLTSSVLPIDREIIFEIGQRLDI